MGGFEGVVEEAEEPRDDGAPEGQWVVGGGGGVEDEEGEGNEV